MMKKIIVIWWLNIDFLWLWTPKICWKWELSYWGKFEIKPGGKSRNIAQMISNQMEKWEVVMIWKTSKDKYWLYNIPLDSLKESWVDISNIIIDESWNKDPWVALIPVDKDWNNQIYVLPWINDNFWEEDLESKRDIFSEVWKNSWILVLSLELPIKTALYWIKLANEYWLKVILDPWGMIEWNDYKEILKEWIYFIKPNEQETKILTWIEIVDFESAKQASKVFMNYWIKNILITVWKKWAYYFSNKSEKHYLIPDVNVDKSSKDETWCWDQTIATLSSQIVNWKSINESIKESVLSGTLQFYKSWVCPLKKEDLLI